MDFIIDTCGDDNLQEKTTLTGEDEAPIIIDKDSKVKSLLDLFHKKNQELDMQATAEEELQKKLSQLKVDVQFDDFFEEMHWGNALVMLRVKKQLFKFDQLDKDTGKLKSSLGAIDVEKEMQKSVLRPAMEKQRRLTKYTVSDMKAKKQRQRQKEKTKGPEWFNIKAPEMTEEIKNDLQVLKMRSVMDPKHFYKKNDMEVLPKYFQVGRIMDSPLDHVNERIPRKDRKRTMVEELLADAEFQKYNKKKYKQIIEEKRKGEYRTHMRNKRQKNKLEVKKNKLKNKKTKVGKPSS